jgi:hypothetical protein
MPLNILTQYSAKDNVILSELINIIDSIAALFSTLQGRRKTRENKARKTEH